METTLADVIDSDEILKMAVDLDAIRLVKNYGTDLSDALEQSKSALEAWKAGHEDGSFARLSGINLAVHQARFVLLREPLVK